MLYYTYIFYSRILNRYYFGSTEDIDKRIIRHNAGYGKYTIKGIPWMLVYREEFATRTMAVRREMEIKGKKSRPYITKKNSSLKQLHDHHYFFMDSTV